MKRITIAAAAAALFAGTAASAADQIVVDGKLTGATGVQVGSDSYNVAFVEGTCETVFGSCTTAAFDFRDETSGGMAAQALLDQVFLDTRLGQFDSRPDLTFGCEDVDFCRAIIPVSGDPNYFAFISNNDAPLFSSDRVGTNRDTRNTNTVNNPFLVFTRFTLVAPTLPAVPESATWAMMIFGMGVVGYAMRRRRQVATQVSYRS